MHRLMSHLPWLSLWLSLALAGCASTGPAPTPPTALFADARFGPPSTTIGADALFTLSPAMRDYLHSPVFAKRLRAQGPRQGLVDALYSKTDLMLEYESRQTRTASETYAARRGNCLSLVIMTAAFAKELGMQVHYRSVDVDDSWSRSGNLFLASAHINIGLGSQRMESPREAGMDRVLVVDFMPRSDTARLRTHELDEADVVALYLNNRAAESLVQDRIDDAYWWSRAAVLARPGAVVALNTLGVVYQRHGDLALAEQAFRSALTRAPESISVLRNLETVLLAQHRPLEAQELARRIAAIEPTPPYYHFDRGMAALKAGDYADAATHFAREVRQAPYNDEFRFWLGVAHLQLGQLRDAREHITVAVDYSTRADMRALYSAKLAHLRDMARSGGQMR